MLNVDGVFFFSYSEESSIIHSNGCEKIQCFLWSEVIFFWCDQHTCYRNRRILRWKINWKSFHFWWHFITISRIYFFFIGLSLIDSIAWYEIDFNCDGWCCFHSSCHEYVCFFFTFIHWTWFRITNVHFIEYDRIPGKCQYRHLCVFICPLKSERFNLLFQQIHRNVGLFIFFIDVVSMHKVWIAHFLHNICLFVVNAFCFAFNLFVCFF